MEQSISIFWAITIAVASTITGNGFLWLALSARIKNLVEATVKEHMVYFNGKLDTKVSIQTFDDYKVSHKEMNEIILANQNEKFDRLNNAITELTREVRKRNT